MGRLSLRLPESLHRQLMTQAQFEGISLNQYLVYLLAQRALGYSVQGVSSEEVERQKTEFARLLEDLGPASHEQIRAALDARDPGEREAGLTPDVVEWLEKNARSGLSAKHR